MFERMKALLNNATTGFAVHLRDVQGFVDKMATILTECVDGEHRNGEDMTWPEWRCAVGFADDSLVDEPTFNKLFPAWLKGEDPTEWRKWRDDTLAATPPVEHPCPECGRSTMHEICWECADSPESQ